MTIHLKITNKIILEKAHNELDFNQSTTLRSLCDSAKAVHYEQGIPAGLLFDCNDELTGDITQGLKFVRSNVYFFGVECCLYEPDRRTVKGRIYSKILDTLRNQAQFNSELFELIAPAMRGEVILDQFGFDYKAQTTVHVTPSALYVHILGVSMRTNVFKTDFGIEIISRSDYRAAVKSGLTGAASLIFAETDPLVIKAHSVLSEFMNISLKMVNAIMSDMYNRVITEPADVSNYMSGALVERELVFIFGTLASILHAFYGLE